jgi:hypothetical protein
MVMAVNIICVHLLCSVYDVIGLYNIVYITLNTLSLVASRGGGGSTPPDPNSEVLTTLSRIPSSVENTCVAI